MQVKIPLGWGKIQHNLNTECPLNDKQQIRGLLRKMNCHFLTSDTRFYNHSLKGIPIGAKKNGENFQESHFLPQGCEKNVFKMCIWYEIL